jgi:hypothetical protein
VLRLVPDLLAGSVQENEPALGVDVLDEARPDDGHAWAKHASEPDDEVVRLVRPWREQGRLYFAHGPVARHGQIAVTAGEHAENGIGIGHGSTQEYRPRPSTPRAGATIT